MSSSSNNAAWVGGPLGGLSGGLVMHACKALNDLHVRGLPSWGSLGSGAGRLRRWRLRLLLPGLAEWGGSGEAHIFISGCAVACPSCRGKLFARFGWRGLAKMLCGFMAWCCSPGFFSVPLTGWWSSVMVVPWLGMVHSMYVLCRLSDVGVLVVGLDLVGS
ncbi:hypothetical protein GOP47_0011789 [Adiantum capillus-veneris]|uniref:Uncharacterized protein n=1 Tax=Adiantum capillus-veneris TaxID=13818 RepID=A0A9D4UTK2_ADICA|nr:hypothetical protein GOP47_0011789 [Adiantum capillus-veneris]